METLSQVGVWTRPSVCGTQTRDGTSELSQDIQHWVNSVSFSTDGNTIASGSYDKTIRLWNANTGRHIRTLTGHTHWVYSVAFSPDGKTIASGSSDRTVLLWELNPTPPSNTVISLSPVSVASPDVGEQLTFSLNITDGENIAGYQATVQFDDDGSQVCAKCQR